MEVQAYHHELYRLEDHTINFLQYKYVSCKFFIMITRNLI